MALKQGLRESSAYDEEIEYEEAEEERHAAEEIKLQLRPKNAASAELQPISNGAIVYRPIKRLGSGGQGISYLAERSDGSGRSGSPLRGVP